MIETLSRDPAARALERRVSQAERGSDRSPRAIETVWLLFRFRSPKKASCSAAPYRANSLQRGLQRLLDFLIVVDIKILIKHGERLVQKLAADRLAKLLILCRFGSLQ